MNQLATLSRRMHLIRLVEKPFRYPSKNELVLKLQPHVSAVSERSVERDIVGIRDELGFHIRFDRQRGGYYLDRPADEDPADFEQLLQLIERREKIEFLKSAVAEMPHASRFLHLEQAPSFAGTEHLPVLWEALHKGCCVQFQYRKFENANQTEGKHIEPGLLFEFRNRWYLDGYDPASNGPRTYGLDRIVDLELTTRPIDPATPQRTNRQHVIGVTAPDGAKPERVVLRFTAAEANYPRTLPLHTSQKIVQETPNFVDFELCVVINHELIREILAFGDFVEVLEPSSLRETVAERVKKNVQKYS